MDRSPKGSDAPWVTEELRQEIIQHRKCFRYYAGDIGDENCQRCPIRESCREARNLFGMPEDIAVVEEVIASFEDLPDPFHDFLKL